MKTSVLQLPAHGTLVIGTDLQGNLRDFERLHAHFAALGSDAHLVLTGDLVHGPDEDTAGQWPDFLGTPYRDESPALIEAFIAAQKKAPGLVHCLMGNHDHAHLGGPVTAKFHPDEAAQLEAQLGPEGTARWRALAATFPLVVIAPCGVVMTHRRPVLRSRIVLSSKASPGTRIAAIPSRRSFAVPSSGRCCGRAQRVTRSSRSFSRPSAAPSRCSVTTWCVKASRAMA